MEYDDILQALCDVWERVKEIMKRFAERIREHRDFYVRTEYTYIPNIPQKYAVSQKKFLRFGGEFTGE